MIWKPNVTVAAVIERDGRFLLVEEHADNEIVFNQPAGHLDPNESLLHAVVRETREETGWRFIPHALTGIYRWSPASNEITYLRFCFMGECDDFDPDRELDQEIIATHWKTRAELTELNLRSPLVTRSIDDYLLGRRYSLDLLVEP